MMKQATTWANHAEHAASQAGVSLLKITFRFSVVLTVMVIALVGLWAVACLVGGAMSAGGPAELISGWFSAVSGV